MRGEVADTSLETSLGIFGGGGSGDVTASAIPRLRHGL